MANDEHVAMLKQGVDAWNKWRDENPDISPDLSAAELIDADLRKASLVSPRRCGCCATCPSS
jgi:hypothetical protein